MASLDPEPRMHNHLLAAVLLSWPPKFHGGEQALSGGRPDTFLKLLEASATTALEIIRDGNGRSGARTLQCCSNRRKYFRFCLMILPKSRRHQDTEFIRFFGRSPSAEVRMWSEAPGKWKMENYHQRFLLPSNIQTDSEFLARPRFCQNGLETKRRW